MKIQEQLRKDYLMRTRSRKGNRQRWNFMNRMWPAWIFWPSRIGFLVFTASVIAGLYVYYRYVNIHDVYSRQNIGTK